MHEQELDLNSLSSLESQDKQPVFELLVQVKQE